MIQSLKIGVLAIVMLAYLYIPSSLIYRYEKISTEGTVFRFCPQPVDPYDAFRGRYVRLNLDIFRDIPFDTTIDFAGNQRVLALDVSVPTNDSPSACGRPLMVVVHGGAWITGDKSENNVSRIRTDFAKRGYTTASVNYRLGQFNTSQAVNCNVQFF